MVSETEGNAAAATVSALSADGSRVSIDTSVAACKQWGVKPGNRLRNTSGGDTFMGTVLGVSTDTIRHGEADAGKEQGHARLWVQFDGYIGASMLEPRGADELKTSGYTLIDDVDLDMDQGSGADSRMSQVGQSGGTHGEENITKSITDRGMTSPPIGQISLASSEWALAQRAPGPGSCSGSSTSSSAARKMASL